MKLLPQDRLMWIRARVTHLFKEFRIFMLISGGFCYTRLRSHYVVQNPQICFHQCLILTLKDWMWTWRGLHGVSCELSALFGSAGFDLEKTFLVLPGIQRTLLFPVDLFECSSQHCSHSKLRQNIPMVLLTSGATTWTPSCPNVACCLETKKIGIHLDDFLISNKSFQITYKSAYHNPESGYTQLIVSLDCYSPPKQEMVPPEQKSLRTSGCFCLSVPVYPSVQARFIWALLEEAWRNTDLE